MTFWDQRLFHVTISMPACMLSRSVLSYSFETPWTVALQASPSMGFPWQEYWSGLPFPTPDDLLTQGSNPCLLCLLHGQTDLEETLEDI